MFRLCLRLMSDRLVVCDDETHEDEDKIAPFRSVSWVFPFVETCIPLFNQLDFSCLKVQVEEQKMHNISPYFNTILCLKPSIVTRYSVPTLLKWPCAESLKLRRKMSRRKCHHRHRRRSGTSVRPAHKTQFNRSSVVQPSRADCCCEGNYRHLLCCRNRPPSVPFQRPRQHLNLQKWLSPTKLQNTIKKPVWQRWRRCGSKGCDDGSFFSLPGPNAASFRESEALYRCPVRTVPGAFGALGAAAHSSTGSRAHLHGWGRWLPRRCYGPLPSSVVAV